ncbi:lipocalin family protein [Emticicia agri]|uniref:Lipocalin-like domain-containing protein n=1 Tax=Emticicia agri TaxID=2492393 RepID=A0A4Q5LYV7_9BACT|nr:lipocalin family protein [Emticicia agri]RYU94757.1 hypothetical protein EWM59_15615 [Emticicia agri]
MKVSSVIRKFTVLLALSSFVVIVMNCSKKDEDPAPDTTLSTQIKATWKVKNVYEKQGSAAETDQLPLYLMLYPCIKDASFTFQDNGNLAGTFTNDCKVAIALILGGSENLKYEVKDNKLIITTAASTSTTFDLSFSGSDMILGATTSGVTRRIVFAKQ